MGFYFINDELYRIQNFSDNSLIGNIYCGYVKDVVKNIDAAFVEFGDNLKGFLSLKNIEKKPKSGSKILVQVTGDKIKTKDYALTLKLNLSSDNLVMVVGCLLYTSFMEDFEKQGGISFILLFFSSLNETYYIPFKDIKFFYERSLNGGRKSFTYDEIDKNYKINSTSGAVVHYLEGIKRDLQNR